MKYLIYFTPLALSLPLLFFLPGYFLTKVFFRAFDRIERFILAVFLSLAMMHGGILAIDKFFAKITEREVAVAVLGVNIICLVIFLVWRRRK